MLMVRWRPDQLPPPSPVVMQAAAGQGLGGFVTTHHLMHTLAPPPGNPLAERWIIRVLILVVAGCLVGALMFFSNGNPGVGVAFLVPIIGVVILAIVRGKRMQNAGPQPYELAYRFQHGMVCPTLNAPVAFRWDSITQVYADVTTHYRGVEYAGTTFQYTLVAANGWQVRFISKDGREPKKAEFVLAQVLQHEVSDRVLATALNQINAGGHAAFGEVAIAQQGILCRWSVYADLGCVVPVRKCGHSSEVRISLRHAPWVFPPGSVPGSDGRKDRDVVSCTAGDIRPVDAV
ncbi:hypothetical protein LWC34_42735 [Kibdelosporangium philippinense]|uniref:Uncharacterized protein n=1 Tax=Kibdelosporangium philippinense TaxID=211113 RepID=A0ABS8ZP00_9PSEU|nr:DUF6585 family protein [Kibdelosporangium philippinense]MCE7009484.1 hypothetical protein [Kibdelosporangium philippinense]